MDMKIETEDMGLRDIAKGYIRFSIKAEDTIENRQVHDSFKEFCSIECDNNYTLGIKRLLEYIQTDYKYELLNEKIKIAEVAIADLKSSIIEKQKPKGEGYTSF